MTLLSSWKDAYLSGVYGIVHDLNPSFERRHLEEAQVRFPHVVKVHRRVFPGVILGYADVPVRNDLMAECSTVGVNTLLNHKCTFKH